MKDEDSNPIDADDQPPKKKISGPQKYRAMVKKTDTSKLAADTTQKPPQTNPVMVEKKDGSVGKWGNDLTDAKRPVPPVKKELMKSDKARGLSSTYYPARAEQQGPAIKTIKPSPGYY